MSDTIVVYHANCVDGFASAFIVAQVLPANGTHFLPMRYEDSTETLFQLLEENPTHLIILDFSFSPEITKDLKQLAKTFIWIDHHESAIRKHFPGESKIDIETEFERILLDTSKCSAILTFQTFFGTNKPIPELYLLIDDYDRWNFHLPDTAAVNEALRFEEPWDFQQWEDFDLEELIHIGKRLLKIKLHKVQKLLEHAMKFSIPFEGPEGKGWMSGLAVNGSAELTNEVGNALAAQCGTFGAVWHMQSSGLLKVSLRSIGDFNVAILAEGFGGGGHKNAASFQCRPQDLLIMLAHGRNENVHTA